MAGRYLLIEFDDEASALSLRAKIDNAAKAGKKFRVVGLFARPGKACSCVAPPTDRAKDRVVRGGKLGWWLCTYCHKPRLGNHQLHNLIDPKEVIEPPRLDGVDELMIPILSRKYVRHPGDLSITTYPEKIVQ